jgi:hypothetical protein
MAIWYILWPFGIFYGHLVYFMAIWYILWPFGIFYGHLVYLWPFGILCHRLVHFPPFWYVVPRKIWQLWLTQDVETCTSFDNFVAGGKNNSKLFFLSAKNGSPPPVPSDCMYQGCQMVSFLTKNPDLGKFCEGL